MHEDWWALWAVWPWHARSHIHITPRLRVNSIAPLLKTPLPAEHTHTHTRMYARTHAHTDSLCLSFLSSGAEARQRGWRVLRISCSSRSLTDSGARGREARGARRERKEEKKSETGAEHWDVFGVLVNPPKNLHLGGWGGNKRHCFPRVTRKYRGAVRS